MAASTTLQNPVLKASGNITISSHTHNQWAGHPTQDLLQTLRERSALGALHDSAERPDPPKCHPQTREAIQDQIDQWARARSADAKPILWLTGAAGAGKSAIAQTLIERWKEERLIVPNFFCWRTSPKRNQKAHIIPTLAFQLTKDPPSARTKIEDALNHGCIFEQSLKSQVEELILGPLDGVLASGQFVVIVIDGLDEVCIDLPPDGGFPGQNYEEQQQELLEAIGFACRKLPSLRVLISSRPERQIRTSFAELPLVDLSLRVSLVDEPNVNADITLYLNCKLAEIRQRHPGIDSSWPSDKQISLLVEKSSGQFIYPSTVIKYISRGRKFPVTSLEDVLTLQARSNNTKEHPLAELDALYTLILRSDIDMGSLPFLREVYPRPSLSLILPYLEELFLLPSGELPFHLTDLHSLLFVPASDGTPEQQPLRFLHATLSEFLCDSSRSENLSLDIGEVFAEISVLLIRHIQLFSSYQLPHHDFPRPELYITALTFISRSSPSMHLMMVLWDFLKAHIGEYNAIDVPPPKPCLHTGLDRLIFSGRKDTSSWQHQGEVGVLKYLLGCNTLTFDQSPSHKELKGWYLKEFLIRFDSEQSIAAWYLEHDGAMATAKLHNGVPKRAKVSSRLAKLPSTLHRLAFSMTMNNLPKIPDTAYNRLAFSTTGDDVPKHLDTAHSLKQIPHTVGNLPNIPDTAYNLDPHAADSLPEILNTTHNLPKTSDIVFDPKKRGTKFGLHRFEKWLRRG